MDEIDLAHVARRWSRQIMVSGDGFFTPIAEQADELGMNVHLVTGTGIVSRMLKRACLTRTRIRDVRRTVRQHRIPRWLDPKPDCRIAQTCRLSPIARPELTIGIG